MGLGYVGEFVGRLKTFVEEEIPQEYKRRQIEIIVFLYSRLIHYTPVRTGHARVNWRVSSGRLRTNVLDRELPMSTEFIRDQLSVIGHGELSPQKIARTVWIYNNVHYIQSLEDGNTVDPALGHMTARAVAETRDFMTTMDWGFGGKGKVMTVKQYRQSRGL